ncbi:LysE family translocator [Phytoactinopolyspora alkaliphila]|uniref:LysE family translocator n=1 Tax=Phytoactinopolyspora alkaliphila TaxID=1783498 RepID=UPI001C209C65
MANAIGGGRRAGVVAALGMSSGLAVHTAAAAFGLGQLFQAAPEALTVVRVVGAAFLVYLAIAALRSSRRDPMSVPLSAERRPIRRIYVMALLTNVANPKVVLFYLAFLPQFVTTGAGSWPLGVQIAALGATLIAIGLIIDSSTGILAGALSERIFSRAGVRRWLDRAAAAIFGGLAIRLALDGR